MKKFLIHPSCTAQWLTLIHEAQQCTSITLHEEIESYLVFLLMRFTNQPDLAASILALDFLESTQQVGSQRHKSLRDVGDKCLLFAGLFPGRAQRRRVQLSYYIKLGQSAYTTVSQDERDSVAQLFNDLSLGFIHLRDILHAVRDISKEGTEMDLWQAMDLWAETRSELAKQTLMEKAPHLLDINNHIERNKH